MWRLSLVMSECSLSGRGQSHVSNFYIVDLENFATASRRYTGDIHKSSVVGLFMTHLRQWKRLGRVMVECTLSITHCLRLNPQLHTIDLARTCHISSFCTVAWQLARFQLTQRIARSLGDSWASCLWMHSKTTSLRIHWSCVKVLQWGKIPRLGWHRLSDLRRHLKNST